jgi:inhibitor of cysteine peptidase
MRVPGIFLIAALAGAQPVAAETLRLALGKDVRFSLKENPSTGYVWRIDDAASKGMDRVTVVDGGYESGADMPGAPGQHYWTLRANAPGRAMIAFVRQRPWEPAAVETKRLDLVISP